MKINSINDFTSQYNGVYSPLEGHWFGLNFRYNGENYRLNTWSASNRNLTVLPDGRTARFGLLKDVSDGKRYTLLGEYASIEDVLFSTVIDNTPFISIITDNTTELISQD